MRRKKKAQPIIVLQSFDRKPGMKSLQSYLSVFFSKLLLNYRMKKNGVMDGIRWYWVSFFSQIHHLLKAKTEKMRRKTKGRERKRSSHGGVWLCCSVVPQTLRVGALVGP